MIWSVPRIYVGETFFLLAGGPSLRSFDPERLRGRFVITINDSWRMKPDATVCYFCDASWWELSSAVNAPSLDGRIRFHDSIYRSRWVSGSSDFREHPQVNALSITGQIGLEVLPTGLRHGSNSGYQAINLAYHFGAKRIVLLGYDMKTEGRRTHWHDSLREPEHVFSKTLSQSMLPLFDHLVEPLKNAGVEVINANPDSALNCWPKEPLENLL